GSSGAAMSRGAAAVLRGWVGMLPVLGAPLRRGAWARSYTALALAFRGGEGLPEAAAIASLAAADRHVEQRWERFARFVEQGQPADVAARKARLPRVDRVAMSIQRPPTDLPSAARFLATRHDAARQRAAAALRGMVLPAVVVLLGVAVGWISYAMFAPLVVLIEATTPEWTVR
ncbi:MAG: type II secretion system F family protein, partial [Planctomycetota bacterium]